MEKVISEKTSWIDKINFISGKFLMPVMAVLFICTNTVFNKWIGERAETLENLIAIVILLAVALNLFEKPKDRLIPWLKSNVLVIIYLIARAISLQQSGFDYSVIRTVFFETFYLIGICSFTISNRPKNNFYIKFFVYFELAITSASLLLYYFMRIAAPGMEYILMKMTYLEKSGNAMLFSNPNTAGIMVGFSIVLAIIYYNRDCFSKKFMLIYGAYNVIALILFGCRSADVGILVVVTVVLFMRVVSKIDKKRIAASMLVILIFTLVPIYVIIEYHESKEHLSYTAIEEKIDGLSSGRYTIWKECAIVQKDNLLFGAGNLTLEQKDRTSLINNLERRWEYSYRYFNAIELGPHNGYIGMISASGWVGFALFMAILLQRIKRAKHLEKGSWYLMLIFIFVINCFESLFILNRFFTCFYMFLILEMDLDEERTGNPKEVS